MLTLLLISVFSQDWTIEKLLSAGIISTKPQQIEFSRLNIKSTVLSKRKLIQLVQQKAVSGWDDPRMPTICGLRRRGVPPAALRLFCERMGISKADSFIDYGILEDCIREVMDDTTPRVFAVLHPLKVTIENWGEELEDFTVSSHPKDEGMGQRTIPFGRNIYIERSDFFDVEGPEGKVAGGTPPKGFKRLLPNGKVRLRYAYVIELNEIVRDPKTQEPIELKVTYLPDTRAGFTPKDMKRVQGIIHWVEASTSVRCQINQYDRLFLTEEPGKESGDFMLDINKDSLQIIDNAVVEPSVAADVEKKLRELAESSSGTQKIYPSSLAYQFERNGYFALDTDAVASDKFIFNRVVTLRDTFAGKKGAAEERKRGGGNDLQQQPKSASTEPIEDLRRVAFRVGTILSAEPHPEADSLLVCQVDCGDGENGTIEPRTVVAGLAGKIPINDLVGQKVVTVTNLKPAKMRGIESYAMLLAASNGYDNDDEVVELLQVPSEVPNGELLSFENKEASQPDEMMKSKGALKAWERVRDCLRINAQGQATYEKEGSSHVMLSSGGPVCVGSLREVSVQ
jgi:methionine--tRNA ligase beta chain